jgi:uncharacterized membrane protein
MWQRLTELWEMPGVQIVFGLTVVFALIAVLWYVVVRLRGIKDQTQNTPDELLLNFREMTAQGGLSYQEYRMIETSLVKGRDDMPRQPTPGSKS